MHPQYKIIFKNRNSKNRNSFTKFVAKSSVLKYSDKNFKIGQVC